MNSYEYGVLAEQTAMQYLQNKGYEIKAHRYKTLYGEIDIVAMHQDSLVFCEVKARRKVHHHENISQSQIKRNCDAASLFLMEHETLEYSEIRFDFLLIVKNTIVQHIENAWEYQGNIV